MKQSLLDSKGNVLETNEFREAAATRSIQLQPVSTPTLFGAWPGSTGNTVFGVQPNSRGRAGQGRAGQGASGQTGHPGQQLWLEHGIREGSSPQQVQLVRDHGVPSVQVVQLKVDEVLQRGVLQAAHDIRIICYACLAPATITPVTIL